MTNELRNYQIARTVVYRHPCDCESASRSLHEGEEAEHRFDVDGKPFPWYITPDGARFVQIEGGLFEVHVGIFGFLGDQTEAFRDHYPPGIFSIAGIDFMWAVTEDGITYRHSAREVPVVYLAFLAEDVDTDGPIEIKDNCRILRALPQDDELSVS